MAELSREKLFAIKPETPDGEIYSRIKYKWDHLSKPIDAFGDFEEAVCRIGAIRKTDMPRLDKRSLLVFCSDNGIVGEGVSQTGSEVTLQVARMLGKGVSSANTLAKSVAAECIPVNVGIDTDEDIEGVLACSRRRGSRNFLREPAMTEEEALYAINAGMELAGELAGKGSDILLTGEMGIGNTTTSTALLCLLRDCDPGEVTGRGAGLDDEGLKRKKAVIAKAVALYGGKTYNSEKEKAFEALCSVGGYDIAAMCGTFIGGAVYGLPVVIDGLISAVAALVAEMMVPGCREYMLASHCGREYGISGILESLGLKAFINGNMALGEGTGALMLLPLLDTVLAYYLNASTFVQGGIKEYERFS